MSDIVLSNIKKESINLIEYIDTSKKNDFVFPLIIENAKTKSLFGMMLNFSKLEINNSVFLGFFIPEVEIETSMNIEGSIFHNELSFKNNIFKKHVKCFNLYVLNDFILENNIFEEFIDFGDCWFKGKVIIKNNEFKKGTNLLGNINKPYKVTFDEKPIIENNSGDLKMNILT